MVGGSPRNKARNADEEAQMHRCVICNKIIEEQRVLALLDMTGEAPEKCIDCAWGGNNPWNSNVDTTTCPSPKIKQPQPMETDAERLRRAIKATSSTERWMVSCPRCQSPVLYENLAQHLRRVHRKYGEIPSILNPVPDKQSRNCVVSTTKVVGTSKKAARANRKTMTLTSLDCPKCRYRSKSFGDLEQHLSRIHGFVFRNA